jgi:hypothetical protein
MKKKQAKEEEIQEATPDVVQELEFFCVAESEYGGNITLILANSRGPSHFVELPVGKAENLVVLIKHYVDKEVKGQKVMALKHFA